MVYKSTFFIFIYLFLFCFSLFAGPVNIEINPLIELDFSSKIQIYSLRKDYVSQYEGLLEKEYTVSDEIFGSIKDDKPWWGILGLSYYGPGQKSIAGLSEESRYIVNPYLLVGLFEGSAHVVSDNRLKPQAIYPEPVRLVWYRDTKKLVCEYNLSDFFSLQKEYRFKSADKRILDLIAYNAKDFGYNYLYVASERSKNIVSLNKTGKPVRIRQFIHCGRSCGYPGGCNNMSPYQPNLRVKVKRLPAFVYIKLWKDNPGDIYTKEDKVVIIKMR